MKTNNIIRNASLFAVVAACVAALGGTPQPVSPLSYAPRTTEIMSKDIGDDKGVNWFDTRLILPFFKGGATYADRVALDNRLAHYFPE